MATFTFDVAQPAELTGPLGVSNAAAQFGTVGGSAPQMPQVPGIDMRGDTTGKTIEALMKMGHDILAPKIEAEKSRMAMEGTLAALQGMSASQIQDDEILGGMFGDSITVAAAQQVERMDAINRFNLDLTQRMPELRQMDPQQFRQWLPEQVRGHLTGDPGTDGVLTQALMERLPQVVDMHTKAHMGYRQEVAEHAWSNDLNTAGAGLAADTDKVRSGELNPDLLLKSQQAFAARLAGPQGIAPEAYRTWINKSYRRFAQEGNLHALNIMEQTGVLEATQDDAQFKALREARDRAEGVALRRLPALQGTAEDRGTMEALISLGASPFSSASDVLRWANRMNGIAQAEGINRPMYDNDAQAKLVESWVKGQAAAAGRNARTDKDLQPAVDARRVHIRNGSAALLKGTEADSQEVRNAVRAAEVQSFVNGETRPEDFARVVMQDTTEEWPEVAEMLKPIKTLLDTGTRDPKLQASLEIARTMATQAGASANGLFGKYLGDHAGLALDLVAGTDGIATPEKLDEYLRSARPELWKNEVREDLATAQEYVRKEFNRGVLNTIKGFIGFGGSAGEVPMTDAGIDQLSLIMAKPMARAMSGTARSPEKAFQIAWGRVKDTTDFVAGIPVQGHQFGPTGSRTLHEAVQAQGVAVEQTSSNYQRAQRAVLDAKLQQYGLTMGDVEPTQGFWDGSHMHVKVDARDGRQDITLRFSPAELKAALSDVQAAEAVTVVMPQLQRQSVPGRPFHTQ